MIVLNGGSYYPESRVADEYWISRIHKDDFVAFIPAATVRSQETYFEFFRSIMEAYGLSRLVIVDLYSDWNSVREAKVIHIAGGSTSKLIDIMRKSGFAEYLQQESEMPIIVGNSAGAVVLGIDIRTANDPIPEGSLDTKGLGLVDFSICPHYDQAKSPRLEVLSKLLNHRVVGIPDNSALVISDQEILFGSIVNFFP